MRFKLKYLQNINYEVENYWSLPEKTLHIHSFFLYWSSDYLVLSANWPLPMLYLPVKKRSHLPVLERSHRSGPQIKKKQKQNIAAFTVLPLLCWRFCYFISNGGENPCGVVANMLNCNIVVMLLLSLQHSSHAITFTFRLILLGKVWSYLSPPAIG